MEPSSQQSSPAIPIAIICGFAMIAIAIFITSKNQTASPSALTANQESADTGTKTNSPRPVDDTDYIRGNPNAPILMVEYSDYDCPFCKQYHATMNQVMDEYGVTGQLAWVYRQFPLVQLHPNSPRVSEAALCVGDIGGNDAFWKFTNMVFEQREIDEQTNITKLPSYAEAAGVSASEYNECLQSGKMESVVVASTEDAFNSGARGTPYTILMVGDQQAVISGAQPYETVKGIVENLVQQLDGSFDVSTAEKSTLPTNDQGVPILE